MHGALFYTRQHQRQHGEQNAFALLVEHDARGKVLNTFCMTPMAMTWTNSEQGAMAPTLNPPLSLAISLEELRVEVLNLAHMVLGSDLGVREELREAFLEEQCVPPA